MQQNQFDELYGDSLDGNSNEEQPQDQFNQ